MSDTVKLYKKRADGTIGLKELTRTMFNSDDDFEEAISFFYGEGYCDTRQEASI